MKFRWTRKELTESSDLRIIQGLINERKSDLNPYAPLAIRLNQIAGKISKGERLTDFDLDLSERKVANGYEISQRIRDGYYDRENGIAQFKADVLLFFGMRYEQQLSDIIKHYSLTATHLDLSHILTDFGLAVAYKR